jgi:Na+/H+ antiporter NhaA
LLAVDWELRVSTVPSGRVARGIVVVVSRPFQWFVGVEARGAVMLLGATGAALVWANSPWIASYDALVPAVVYLALNPSGSARHGRVIVLAADLALVLSVLALVGARCHPQRGA